MQSKRARGAEGVHPLIRLSSQGDYAIVDQQAPQVLREHDVRTPHGPLHEFFYTTKRKAVAVLLRPSANVRHQRGHTPIYTAVSSARDPYDTSDWEDADDTNDEYIKAQHIADSFRGKLSCWYPQINDNSPYRVSKYRIVESHNQTSDQFVRDYFLKIDIGAPTLNYLFVQIRAKDDPDGAVKLEIVPDYLKPKPRVPLQSCT